MHGACATVSPGGLTIREYGSMPVTSPARHSITLCRPAPRSTEDRDMTVEQDVHALDDSALGRQDFAFVEVPARAVGGKPREFLGGCGPERLVLGQLFDQFGV